ncbi:MAG: DEAD/DEAH box helicase [Sarcina sp.]
MFNYNKRELKRLSKKADRILKNKDKYAKYSQEEIINLTNSWKDISNLNKIIEDVFVLCREITKRVLYKSQYKVQIIGGLVLAEGRIAEMRTGEGKTLTELCPAFLNALTSKGVHILTVNDYLCERDYDEMRAVFEYAGLTVGLVTNDTSPSLRKEAYAKDITYTTNTEVGFDYLRDNTAKSLEGQVLRGLNYVIIDELDSVLIDDARTPLILAQEVSVDNEMYNYITSCLKGLEDEDVKYNVKESYVMPTAEGILKIEKLLGLKNFSWNENSIKRHVVYQCLRAKYLFKLDRDYIIRGGEVELIDISTGRIADGRKLSDGLHQAIEAKEGVKITNDTFTTASITYQNFFKLYDKVSGMSGTINTDALEMEEFYFLDVIVIPTNKPIERIDENDIMCINKLDKYKKIKADVQKSIEKGIPVLIGTSSIKESESLSRVLNESGVEHKLLNAKTKSEEAQIISKAGEKGAVTIATNIAGRGTDIKISDEVNELGGLRVISTERNVAKRIDNQLIGRSGRQGNNGSSVFYLSPSDQLFKEYADEFFVKKAEKLNGEKKLEFIKKVIHKTQRIIEKQGYDSRKDVIKRDYVIDLHRNIIYKQRQELVSNDYDMNIVLANFILEEVTKIVDKFENIDKVADVLSKKFNMKILAKEFDEDEYEELINYYTEFIITKYNELACSTTFSLSNTLGQILIYIIDINWIKHVDKMEELKRASNHQSYVQIDPFVFYRKKAGELYLEMIDEIRTEFLKDVFYGMLVQVKEAQEEIKKVEEEE